MVQSVSRYTKESINNSITKTVMQSANPVLLIIVLFITIVMIFVIFIYINKNKKNNEKANANNLEPFDCTLNISDVNPYHVLNYMKYDNNLIGCGICKNSNLSVNIQSTCPTNKNGSVDNNTCRPQFDVTSSYNIPIVYDKTKTREGIHTFFCPIRKI